MKYGCDEARRAIDPWMDGELDPSAAVHVDVHLADCPNCRCEAETIRALKRSIGGLREASAPTALRLSVYAALDAVDDARAQEASVARKKKHALGFALTGAALAGAIIAHRGLMGGGARETSEASFAGLIPVVEDVAAHHAHDLPMEVSGSNPDEVSQWFRGKLDIPVQPMAFRGISARLVGGRISNVREQMAAALYYDLGGRRMTVFVFDGALVPRQNVTRQVVNHRNFYVGSSHGYTVTFTEQRGVGYAVACDLPPQETVRLVADADMR